MNPSDNTDLPLAFEEFQLYYDTTERVTERRIATNRWNYSICTAILTLDGALFTWAIANPNFMVVSLTGLVVISFMAALYCSLWIGQIQDFKQLNNAKFTVLNRMAAYIRFSSSDTDNRKSYCPFDKEWAILKESKAVQEMYKTNIIALNSSNIEYAIPAAFRILFILIIAAAAIIAIRNWDLVPASTSLQFAAPTLTSMPVPTATIVPSVTPTP